MSSVHLTFRYFERDYVHALQAHYASRLRFRFDVLVAVGLAALGVYHWESPTGHWFGVICLVVSIVFALMLIAAFTVIPRLMFRREPKFRDDYSLTFSADGIHFRTQHIDSQLQWSMYSRALVDAHSYVLYYGTSQFTVIPTRVFESSDQQETFERLLTEHVSEIVRRPS